MDLLLLLCSLSLLALITFLQVEQLQPVLHLHSICRPRSAIILTTRVPHVCNLGQEVKRPLGAIYAQFSLDKLTPRLSQPLRVRLKHVEGIPVYVLVCL